MTLTRTEFATTEPDVLRAALSAEYTVGLSVARSGDDPFSFERHTASDGAVTVAAMRFSGRIAARMAGARDVLFADIAAGRYAWRSGEDGGDQSRALVVPAMQRLEVEVEVEFESVESVMVRVDPVAVERGLARYGGLPPAPALLRRAFAGSEPVRQAVRFYGRVMADGAFESELVRANLLDLLLSVTAHDLMRDAPASPRRAAPAALDRAVAYFRAHVAEPIRVDDAAVAARLSVRALHEQFRTWLGVTPSRYLRNLRLEGTRTDLITARADGEPVQVADVARRWGFAHLGRFAAYYADAYGETPGQTLRGARSA